VAFLGQIVALEAKGREIHIIADNLSAHKTKRVAQFLAEHPQLHLHFTPTYSSWLNQVELWFARIEREVVPAGSSPRSTTWRASSCVISAITTNMPRPSNGPIVTSLTESRHF
jgi:transposase